MRSVGGVRRLAAYQAMLETDRPRGQPVLLTRWLGAVNWADSVSVRRRSLLGHSQAQTTARRYA